MSLHTYRKNCCFPLSSLPNVVICHIAQYLGPRDLGNMSKVSQYFRQVFNSPQLWNGIKILWDRNSKMKIDPLVLETIKSRGITELLIWTNYDIVERKIDLMLQCIPYLEGLSFYSTSLPIYKSLQKFASSCHLDKLKKLSFGHVFLSLWQLSNVDHVFTALFEQLPRLQELGFGRNEQLPSGYPMYELKPGSDLQRAICQSGKLTSISLMNLTIYKSCLDAIMKNNPFVQTLSFGFILKFAKDDDLADPAVCSSLTSLEIRHASKDTINHILYWAFPDIEPSRNLTSLNLSYSQSSRVFQFFAKFPALKKLDLTGFRFTKNMSVEAFRHLKNLEWLELKGCNRISGKEISELSESVGRTLRYLGLADLLLHPLIADNHLRDLASMFPVLRTLDLTGCVTITDALLVEWYVKNEETSWPKLRKLVLKNCGVSQEVVNLVHLKTKNHLLVELCSLSVSAP